MCPCVPELSGRGSLGRLGMPQGWLQVDRFVIPQNSTCIVSGAINRAKSNFRNILPLTPTHSRFCAETFFPTQWNQDFSCTRWEGGTSVVGCQLSVVRKPEDVSKWSSDKSSRRPLANSEERTANDGKRLPAKSQEPKAKGEPAASVGLQHLSISWHQLLLGTLEDS